MKVSHDDSSWRASGVIARDRRAQRNPEDERPVGRAGGKKNTRRWCRGRVGVSHRPEWVRHDSVYRNLLFTRCGGWLVERCRACGKVLGHCRSQVGAGPCQRHHVRHLLAT